ncbi:hypothetical protein [Streptomyces uncialis]|uniref:hypothetical protein n=1 Tax=Streptomyces uncialis TaxID=1048205 RepID=UPI00340BF139
MSAGSEVVRLIEAQLTEAREQRASLEARAVLAITSSGVLVTLQLGFIGLIRTQPPRGVPATAQISIGLAILCFVCSGAYGILVNMPRTWKVADPQSLVPFIRKDGWSGDEERAQREIARLELNILIRSRQILTEKSRQLTRAFICELVGVTVLGVTTCILMLDS